MCADAAADPIAGLHAAVAAAGSLLSGCSHLVDVSLRAAVTATLAGGRQQELVASAAGREWVLPTEGGSVPVEAPRSRTATGDARPFGADTEAVLAELGGK
jgi:hypothetical protein